MGIAQLSPTGLQSMTTSDELRKSIGQRLKSLRKHRKWAQKEVAQRMEITHSLLNKYEGGVHIPPADKLVQLADIYDTTTDYLLTGIESDERPLFNQRLLERFRALEDLSSKEQESIMLIVDALTAKKTMEETLSSFSVPVSINGDK